MIMPIRNTAATAEQATPSTAEPARSAIREVAKSVPSMSSNDLHRLRWNLSVLVSHAVKNLPAAAVENFMAPAGTKIAFEGKIDQDAYVYLVQVAEPSQSVTTYPVDGEAIQVKAGETTRIPAEGWLVTPTRGRIFVFSSPNPLSHKEIVAALDGRDPPPGQAGGPNATPDPADDPDAKLAEFGKISDAGVAKASQGPLAGSGNPGTATAAMKA
ncbi:hypothetical protein WMF37_46205 [Sorangium sp. So ce291]|uniref:hypothetical protein n=1 Tax=Sorangium sp. So ce291 TaxID=3133294 RepID=UPI003F5FDCAB